MLDASDRPRLFKGLAHACFVVADLEQSLHFYCDLLGMTPAFEFVRDGVKYGQYVHVGGRTFIELFQRPLNPRAELQSYQHLCLEVEDCEMVAATLRARGVEVSEVKLGGDNSYQCWITDPDGNRMELHGATRPPASRGGGSNRVRCDRACRLAPALRGGE